jgi:hypothetical protein
MDCACTVVNIVKFVFQFILYGTARDAMLSTRLVHIYTTCDTWYYAPAFQYDYVLTIADMKVICMYIVQIRIGSLGINKATNALSNAICFSKPNNFLIMSAHY